MYTKDRNSSGTDEFYCTGFKHRFSKIQPPAKLTVKCYTGHLATLLKVNTASLFSTLSE